jgi:hypothetical protein
VWAAPQLKRKRSLMANFGPVGCRRRDPATCSAISIATFGSCFIRKCVAPIRIFSVANGAQLSRAVGASPVGLHRDAVARLRERPSDRRCTTDNSEKLPPPAGVITTSQIKKPRFWTILHSLYARARRRPCGRMRAPIPFPRKGVQGAPEGDFFVRSGPGTVKLPPDSAKEYIRTRFVSVASDAQT